MIQLIIFIFFSFLTYSYSNIIPSNGIIENRIIGGDEIQINKIPWQVSILFFGQHICGGTIIDENVIITSSHCIFNVENIRYYKVRVGSSKSSSGGNIIAIKSFHKHNNIMLAFLEEKLNYGPEIQKIEMAKQNQTFRIGTIGTVSGWGEFLQDGLISDQLNSVEVPIIDLNICKELYAIEYKDDIRDSMICAGLPEDGEGTCHRDSGGPLIVNKTLVGIVLWGFSCGQSNLPGVYASISYARDRIDEIINKENI